MTHKVTIRRTDGGISVSAPALPGCWSKEPAALENTRDTTRQYRDALEDRMSDSEVREESFLSSLEGFF